jgi:hypothetical protein|tara:strand:- start:994 stop:1467 length:474 start_codon:yes stop_codon:yes gene_type:complete
MKNRIGLGMPVNKNTQNRFKKMNRDSKAAVLIGDSKLASMPTSKYKNKKTKYQGILYDSMLEAKVAKYLNMLKSARNMKEEVVAYERQVKFPVHVNGHLICTLILDFMLGFADGRTEYWDAKGIQTPVFRLKKKLVEAFYGIKIKLITENDIPQISI